MSVASEIAVVMTFFVLSSTSSTQVVINPWDIPCKQESVQPNLVLKATHHIYGELKDPSGAALEKSKVILRNQTKKGEFIDYRIALTDANGRFDLNSVGAGLYRFLRDRTEDGSNRGG